MSCVQLRGATPPPHKHSIVIPCPLNGRVSRHQAAGEKAFSLGLLGPGAVILPAGHSLYAPFNGVIQEYPYSAHRLSIRGDNGLVMTMFFGHEASLLHGEGFIRQVKIGTKVKSGQLLMGFKLPLLTRRLRDHRFIITLANVDKAVAIQTHEGPRLANEDSLFTLYI